MHSPGIQRAPKVSGHDVTVRPTCTDVSPAIFSNSGAGTEGLE